MKRSELSTKYYKNSTHKNLSQYKKHKNFCSRLYKKERRKYYSNLDIKKITDNKQFWNTLKPFISDKCNLSSKITLVEEGKIISEDMELANTFQNFFDNAVSSLSLQCEEKFLSDASNLENPVDAAIEKFKNHPSISLISKHLVNNKDKSLFAFDSVNEDDILKELNNLDSKKNGTFKGIPTKSLKVASEECKGYLTNVWNEEIVAQCCFPDELKLADVTPIFKKNDPISAKNYRPVSVLPTVSKIFERIMQKQIVNFMNCHLSPYLCGYRKGFSTQTALLSLLEKWKKCLDKNGYAGAVLMDLSKAFDTINHELLIAKLHAYGFSRNSLALILSYLRNRFQHVK